MPITVKPNSVTPTNAVTPKDAVTTSYFDPALAASKVSKAALRNFGNSTKDILSAIYGNPALIMANKELAHTFNDDFMPEVKTAEYDADRKVPVRASLSTYKVAPAIAYPEDEEANSNVITIRRR